MKTLEELELYQFSLKCGKGTFMVSLGISKVTYKDLLDCVQLKNKDQLKDLEVIIRSEDIYKSYLESDGFYILEYFCTNEDKIIGMKEGVEFGYKCGVALANYNV